MRHTNVLLVLSSSFISLLFFFFFFIFSSAFVASGDNTITLYNATELIELSNDVADGASYAGTTILLGADLDFSGSLSEEFNPIGKDYEHYFSGIFNGQGHVISNLAINSSEQFVGLFGVTNATGIRNVVLDASCSVLSSYVYPSETAYVAGIASYTNSTHTIAYLDSCVNMASVTFTGNTMGDNSFIAIGGVIGYFETNSVYSMDIKNCVNYGMIDHAGAVKHTSMGGIVGAFFSRQLVSENRCDIRNCANYGTFVHSGISDTMFTEGGITGVMLRSTIENCINFGTLVTNKPSEATGKISGSLSGSSSISHCFWTNENGSNNSYGYKFITEPTVKNSYLVEPNETSLGLLNSWAGSNSNSNRGAYRDWAALHPCGGLVGGADDDMVIIMRAAFPDPTREGHNFDGWCTDENCTDGVYRGDFNDITTALYAQWSINNYTLTFDFENGTVIESLLCFNDTIVYPEVAPVKGKVFEGWSSNYERMPGRNLTISPVFSTPEKSKSNAGAIAGGVIGGLAAVALVVLIVLFVLLRRSRTSSSSSSGLGERSRIGSESEETVGGGVAMSDVHKIMPRVVDRNTRCINFTSFTKESALNKHVDLYPEGYCAPSMREALMEAGMPVDKAERVATICATAGRNAQIAGKLFGTFTEADAAAVSMYTFDFGAEDFENNPYRVINKALTGTENPESIRGLLFIMMSALRKLPRSQGRMLYRGVRENVRKDMYREGSVVMWQGFSSTSPDMKKTKDFLSAEEELVMTSDSERLVSGTLFIIEGGWGYDVQPFSLFPDEEEILLEPERQFQVQSFIETETAVVIKLKMMDTPLALPQFFGEGRK